MGADPFSHFLGEFESWCEPPAPLGRRETSHTGRIHQARREALLTKVKLRLAEQCPAGAGVHTMTSDAGEDKEA